MQIEKLKYWKHIMISLEFDNELMRNKPNRKILPLFTLLQALTFLSDNETQVPIQSYPT